MTDDGGGSKRGSVAEHIRQTMATEGAAVGENTRVFNQNRYDAIDRFEGYETARSEARAVKEDAIARLPALLETLRSAVADNGGSVYIAEDAEDATDHIRSIAADVGAERVVKSKSMTTEEIEVNDALGTDGVDVVETDLGEWIIQLADESPSHLIAPAIHKSRSEISALFAETFELDDPPETATELTRFARDRLGEHIRTADIGMTGANFVAADSGTLAIVTSEGNARKSVVVPPVQITVTGIEKVVPTVESMAPFIELIGKTGTGQDITSYVSFLTPPIDAAIPDFTATPPTWRDASEREFHLVLIDNGRTSLRDDPDLRETLYCIRCSACSNSCGNFQSVGGHVFGGETYSGGIGAGWEAGIEGLDVAGEFTDLCTGCSRCVPACPVKIDIPWINTTIRDRINRDDVSPSTLRWLPDGLLPDEEPGGIPLEKRVVGNFDRLARLGAATAPISNRLRNAGPVRVLLERVAGIDRRRALPAFAPETFREWFERRADAPIDPGDARDSIVLVPDTSTNYFVPSRGKAAVRLLEACDIHVSMPAVPGSGRPPLSQGMIETARARAVSMAESLQPHLAEERTVVVIEPSDAAMFRRDYSKLLDRGPAERIGTATVELMAYLERVYHAEETDTSMWRADDAAVGYHPHCQGRTIGAADHAGRLLGEFGYDVKSTDTECCGMAGSFGYKQSYYELSLDVGEPIVEQLAESKRIPTASGFSCQEHLSSLLDCEVYHPVELLDPTRSGDAFERA